MKNTQFGFKHDIVYKQVTKFNDTLFSSVLFTAYLCIQREIQRGIKDKVLIMQQRIILVCTTQE